MVAGACAAIASSASSSIIEYAGNRYTIPTFNPASLSAYGLCLTLNGTAMRAIIIRE